MSIITLGLGEGGALIMQGVGSSTVSIPIPVAGGGRIPSVPTVPPAQYYVKHLVLQRDVHGSWIGAIEPRTARLVGALTVSTEEYRDVVGGIVQGVESLIKLWGAPRFSLKEESEIIGGLLRQASRLTEEQLPLLEGLRVTAKAEGATIYERIAEATITGSTVVEVLKQYRVKGVKDLKQLLYALLFDE